MLKHRQRGQKQDVEQSAVLPQVIEIEISRHPLLESLSLIGVLPVYIAVEQPHGNAVSLAVGHESEIQTRVCGQMVWLGEQCGHGRRFTVYKIVVYPLPYLSFYLGNLLLAVACAALHHVHLPAKFGKGRHQLLWTDLAGRWVVAVNFQRYMEYQSHASFFVPKMGNCSSISRRVNQ